ncbi:MAG: hypothetical protein WBL85_03045 [Sedimentisphaerales bacterium]
MIERIGPVCRFGPGGDYESVWPGEWMEQATQPKNAIGRLLDVIAGMTDVIRGGDRCVEVTGPIDIEQENKLYESDERGTGVRRGAYAAAGSVAKHNRGVSDQQGLFADDWRAGAAVKHKPSNRIRTHRTTAKKRTCVGSAVSFDEGQGTLFELDFKGAKTA